jgi:hypothetical protein
MSLALSSEVPSYFIIQATVCSQGLCSHLSTTWCIFKCCIFYRNLSTQPGFVFVDKENCHQEDNKKGPLRMLSFHSRMLLKQMMMSVGSDEMIVSFLYLVLRSRQTVMFAIRSLVQEKYPMCVKILGHL